MTSLIPPRLAACTATYDVVARSNAAGTGTRQRSPLANRFARPEQVRIVLQQGSVKAGWQATPLPTYTTIQPSRKFLAPISHRTVKVRISAALDCEELDACFVVTDGAGQNLPQPPFGDPIV